MISIIIPTLNEAKIIESTLRTLAATLTLPHEVIVSDGGSSDRTAELATRHANTVVVYSGAGRQTIGKGRNNGAKAATGSPANAPALKDPGLGLRSRVFFGPRLGVLRLTNLRWNLANLGRSYPTYRKATT